VLLKHDNVTRVHDVIDVGEDEKGNTLIENLEEEWQQALGSLDPNVKIPGYLELRIRPRQPFFEELLDCFWLEFVYSRRHPKHYTRPLWQLLKAAGQFHEQDEKYPRQVILGFPVAERRRFSLIFAPRAS